MRGEFTLEARVGRSSGLKVLRCDLLVVPPLVTGSVKRVHRAGTLAATGWFVRHVRQTTLFGSPAVGELILLAESSGERIVAEIDTRFWGSWTEVAESAVETLTSYVSDNLLRHLARNLTAAERDLTETRRICAGLADRDSARDVLRHAAELWNEARLLLLLDDARSAASRALEGAERLGRSGLEPEPDMAESGAALVFVLGERGYAEAAGRVRDTLGPATSAYGLPAVHHDSRPGETGGAGKGGPM
ncbi:hypothetical protein [Streptomyces albipurpureus]|uniref:Uncharacterized protein n=1 Tax=Streptomyces albipurpureus TaxID=2897419 RepID=A0ABT0UGW2_9ACTN|nr:hypothetical protein [Streptomyces sp. CWNU-1]MCM2387674.1 hypothetical protein [Streptomyces sp. CWNU-1]